ncbi:unnamed protein product [Thelazia callipaeda]|uniref:Uncharacterized protein n=1 Tax=Thelazia callipaeda TaxID=103827 RepID=A0A0N5CTS4_THECL|nr:unnamed protein product [Thelazia callipaeda]
MSAKDIESKSATSRHLLSGSIKYSWDCTDNSIT